MSEPDWREELGATIGYAESYIERKIQIAKLDVAEKAAKTGASLATGLILVLLAPILLTTLSIGIGFLLANWLEVSIATGFFILTAFYLVLMILAVALRKQLFTEPILTKIVREIFKK